VRGPYPRKDFTTETRCTEKFKISPPREVEANGQRMQTQPHVGACETHLFNQNRSENQVWISSAFGCGFTVSSFRKSPKLSLNWGNPATIPFVVLAIDSK
jgi:hypothetical protein